ncbi:uncharacterized protein LOC136094473 [Hydra vulgaris]|uniref:uncharacterized protein LOC136094473 n=1 Tax=Hydra vulgaris TaxID=6087 RepID=UPI0032E9C2AB
MLNSHLFSLYEARWIVRHDALLTFSVELPQVIDALDNISKWNDRTSLIKARILFISVRENLLIVLKHNRENSKEMFMEIFRAAEKTKIEKNGIFTYKRIVQRQTCRENIPSDSMEEYYRRSIYIPLLDALILDISTRFSNENLQCLQIYALMPKNIVTMTHKDIVKTPSAISNVYGVIFGLRIQNLPAPEFTSEVELWQCKCLRMKDEKGITSLPTDLSVAFDLCDQVQYPITHKLFKIIKTCPVSVASAERSFSTLRRIKNWLRTRMTENRLVGLALLDVHKEIPVNVEKVIDRFANSGNRKL